MEDYLEVWGQGSPAMTPLAGPRITIGRHESNDVALPDDPEVSRVHAVLERLGPAWVVRDVTSRNGTRVNGDLVAADRPLAPGDEIRVGGTRIVLRSRTDAPYAATEGAEPPPALTPRERDVLLELFRPSMAQGPFNEPASTRDIAAALVVSEAAVKQHLANLFDKFDIHTGLDRRRVRLANEALRRGAVSLADVRARFDG